MRNATLTFHDASSKEVVGMVNTIAIKVRLLERGKQMTDLAPVIGKSYASVQSKINNKTAMTLDEALKIQQFLGITDDEFTEFFFIYEEAN